MGASRSTAAPVHQLPWVLATTLAVVGLPMLLVSALRASDVLTSMPILVGVGMIASIGTSQLGAVCWAASSRAGDTVFGDLMLWGWLRRRRSDRQIASASALFAPRAKGMQRKSADVRRHQRMLQQLATTLEARDPATQGHSRRVARHAAAIAKRMGLPPDEVAKIRAGAALHDVGKISTPVSLLNKPGKLTDEEFAVIQQHPIVGAEAVASLGDEALVGIVRHHHERIDGRGYPDGLKGDAIPIGARIVAVADTFDAVTSPRPYRSAKRHRDALLVLDAVAGTQLDTDAVGAFRSYYSGLRGLAFWALALNGPRQLLTSLFDQAKLGHLQVTGAATAATVATVVAGGVALHSSNALPDPAKQPQASSSGVLAPASSDLVSVSSGHSSNATHRSSNEAGSRHRGTPHGAVASRHEAGAGENARGTGGPRSGADGSVTSTRGTDSPAASTTATSPPAATRGNSGKAEPVSHVRSAAHAVHSVVHTAVAPVRHSGAVKSVTKTVGSATAAVHAVVPETPPAADAVTVPVQAEAIGLNK